MDPTRIDAAARPGTFWRDEHDKAGIPLRMLCLISREVMLDPVLASDGYTYDAPMLRRLLRESGAWVSPMTREQLLPHFLPNENLQREIDAMLEANVHLRPSLTPQQHGAVDAGVERGLARHIGQAAVLASDLPDDSSVEASFAEDLQRLLPGPALRRTRRPIDDSFRRLILFDTPWASAVARTNATHQRVDAPLVAPDSQRAYMGVMRHTLRPPSNLVPPAVMPERMLGWLDEAPLFRMLAALRAESDADAEATQPLVMPSTASGGDEAPQLGGSAVIKRAVLWSHAVEAWDTLAMGQSSSIPLNSPLAAPLAPGSVSESAISDDDETAWDSTDWGAEPSVSEPDVL